MAKRSVVIPAEVIQNLQKDFKLDNYDLAELFGVSLSSALDWLKNGVRGGRGHSPVLVEALLALKYLSEKDPEGFLSFGQLKSIVHKLVKTPGFMYLEFLPYQDELGAALTVLKHQKLASVIMAVMFILYLWKKGKEIKLREIGDIIEGQGLF